MHAVLQFSAALHRAIAAATRACSPRTNAFERTNARASKKLESGRCARQHQTFSSLGRA